MKKLGIIIVILIMCASILYAQEQSTKEEIPVDISKPKIVKYVVEINISTSVQAVDVNGKEDGRPKEITITPNDYKAIEDAVKSGDKLNTAIGKIIKTKMGL